MNFKMMIRASLGNHRLIKKFDINTFSFLIVILFLFTLISCAPKKLPVKEIVFERDRKAVSSMKAEIAVSKEERSRGLMNREKLNDGEGMLFIFESDSLHSFWMKDTLIPLSIAFILSDGKILEIKDMYPKDLSSVSPSRSVRYALEAPQGWFARTGILPGDVVKW